MIERSAEYLLSIPLIGFAIFLFREVWISVQVLEEIHKALLEGAIFTEGPPILGVKRYLLFCLCSGAWFLLAFAFLLSRRGYLLYLEEFTFFLTPVWFVFYAYIKAIAFTNMVPYGIFCSTSFCLPGIFWGSSCPLRWQYLVSGTAG